MALDSGLGELLAYVMIFFVVAVISYVYFALALMTIAKKTNTPNAWLAWIPIANVYLMTQVAELPAWWTLAILLALIPVVGPAVVVVISAYWWWKISERLGKPGWWGILTIIPIVNFVIMGMLAWGNTKLVK